MISGFMQKYEQALKSHKKFDLTELAEVQAENVRVMRAVKGWSRTEVNIEYIAVCGSELSETALRRIETGARPMRASEACVLAEVFGVDPVKFMTVRLLPEFRGEGER